MLRGRAVLHALLGIGLGLLLSSHSCQVRVCSGDCCDDGDDDCREELRQEPPGALPLFVPRPGIVVPVPHGFWFPPAR